MQSIQRKILLLVLTIALFSSVAFAEGEMGGGGLSGNEPAQTKVITSTSGDRLAQTGSNNSDSETGLDWLINSIAELLGLDD